MTSLENLTSSQKIRAALHRDVRAICIETCHFLGLEITKPAMEIVAELVYKKLSVYGTDLEAFAKHAKRATIGTDDVKLLVRRCPSLKSHLNTLAPKTNTPKEKRRKTVAGKVSVSPASKQKETDIPTLRQKEPETSALKPEPAISTSDRNIEKGKSTEIAEIDKMDLDMIDLTFD